MPLTKGAKISIISAIIAVGVAAIVAAVSLSPNLGTSNQTSNNEDISINAYLKDDDIHGMDYPLWTAKWWKWALSIPEERNPIHDRTGEFCQEGQNDPNVWFVAGTPGFAAERTCQIPAGMSMLFSPLNGMCSDVADNLNTDEELRSCAITFMEGEKRLEIKINGKPVPQEYIVEITSPPFEEVLPERAAFGLASGSHRMVAHGHWLLLKELDPGQYDIDISGRLTNPVAGVDFGVSVKWHITVT